MARRVWWAIAVASVCHAVLVLAGRYRSSYDAYTHMLFADHYLHHWGSLWEPRWYTGFSVTSYPPLVHQVMALAAAVIGVDAAFAVLLWLVAVSVTIAVYAFARIFTGADAAGYAAIGAAVLPSIYLAAYVFGQLPTLAAAVLALFAFAALAQFVRSGARLSGGLVIALFTTVAATHHATLLLLPLGAGAIGLHMLANRLVPVRTLLVRLAIVAIPSALACILVVWPFWLWGLGQAMQTPIDHLSRHNFLADRSAALIFFLPVYGFMATIIPFAFRHTTRRVLAAPALLFVVLFVLGLGGTTPLPRLLFGPGWEWLTYDRFALWASLVLLIFCGQFAVTLRRRLAGHLWSQPGQLPVSSTGIRSWLDRMVASLIGLATARPVRKTIAPAALLALGAAAVGAALFPLAYPTQPTTVAMQPIATFLNQDDHVHWRYVTFGFGDQYASLSLLTSATTIDGSYHSARSLPILRQSGIGQIDTAFWSDKGLDALDPILRASDALGVRWGFVNRIDYNSILLRNGWVPLQTLVNGIEVWENPNAFKPVAPNAPAEDPLQLLSWQVLPLLALGVSAVLTAGHFRPVSVTRALDAVRALTMALIPLSLCFWLYCDLIPHEVNRVYFTYTDALLFACDVLIAIAVCLWILVRAIDVPPAGTSRRSDPAIRWLMRSLLAFCILCTVSVAWSVDARVSLIVAVHLWLLFLFVYTLRDRPISWRIAGVGASIALAVQSAIGIAQFGLRSTAFLSAVNMKWPGTLDASMRGASVVQLADGSRWLRAYGTLPHPNILGGLILILMLGPLSWWLVGRRQRWVPGLIVVAGVTLLILTFSRSAWLGAVAAGAVIAFHHKQFDRQRLIILATLGIAGALIGLVPLGQLALTRVTAFNIPTEQQSLDDRAWMAQQALLMIRSHPLVGVGLGGFPIELARHDPGSYMIEPVHNLLLLAASELGLPGLGLVLAITVILVVSARNAGDPLAVISAAVLIGLAVTAMFDHYLWALAPTRALLWWAIGMWAGWWIDRRSIQIAPQKVQASHRPLASAKLGGGLNNDAAAHILRQCHLAVLRPDDLDYLVADNHDEVLTEQLLVAKVHQV